jgi:U3 small nucleolar ribonucleoprotein protein IMP3
MRQLKFHEKKLLKKVNFLEWKRDHGLREVKVMRRYHIVERDDYHKYNKMCGMVTKLVNIIKKLDPKDPFRVEMTENLLDRLYNMGVVPTKKGLSLCNKLSVSSFCRRRLAVVMVRLKFAENLKEAATFVEQGHIRVGPDTVTDPAFLVTRNMEDFVTWVDTSKIKRKVLQYNDKLDDYDLLN